MLLKVTVATTLPRTFAGVLVLPLYQGSQGSMPLSSVQERAIRAELKRLKFKGSWGAAECFAAPKGMRAKLVAAVGLGDPKASVERRAEGLRRGVATVVQEARRQSVRELAVYLAGISSDTFLPAAALEAADLASYRFAAYSRKRQEQHRARSLKQLWLVVDKAQLQEVQRSVRETQQILRGVELARELVNQPAQYMSPKTLVGVAKAIREQSEKIKLTIWNREQAAKQGFNAFLAVARGSEEEPYVIHLTYAPRPANKVNGAAPLQKVVLVGKGITFDSGGLSIKPADGMESMKIDMAGAATVLGVFAVLARMQLPIEVHGVIAACENMPSGKAYRPGDVLTAKNGKTIEVLNTDAEGRITLADALSFALEQKPDYVVDLATLTGSCMVALGETYAGLFGNSEQLVGRLKAAAQRTGEGLEDLPLPEEYRPLIESKVADVRNTATSRYGGAITAALFLREFVGKTPWAHLDIAGPAYAERILLPYWQHGATGYGVRMLVELLKQTTART